MKNNKILILYKQKQTVFNVSDIALLWKDDNLNNIKSAIKYYIDKGDLIRLRRGVYSKPEYQKLELVSKIYSPAYISFETVLMQAGIVFQYYETLYAASYLSREIQLLNGQKIIYRKLQDKILIDSSGLIQKNGYQIASPERAFLDVLYIYRQPFFDNLKKINWQKCQRLVPLYNNKSLIKRLNNYQKKYA